MPNEIIPGFYGKVPTLGDFVLRRLPAGFVKPWDAWLQEAIKIAHDQAGADFDRCYSPGPAWRFVLGPGSCGKFSAAGIMAPSFDKVGRSFPLTLAIVADGPLFQLMLRATQWFSQLEILVDLLMKKKIDLKQFDHQLQQQKLPAALFQNKTRIEANMLSPMNDPLFFRLEMNSLHQTPEAFEYLTSHLLERHLSTYSLWCAKEAGKRNATLSLFRGLPPPERYFQFLADPLAPAE